MRRVRRLLAECASACVGTLAHPIRRFQPVIPSEADASAPPPPAQGPLDATEVHPRLLVFVFVGIVLGSLLTAAVPARKYSGDVAAKVVVLSLCWLSFVVTAHAFCRVLGGKAEFERSFWVGLQISAVLFVISSLASLGGGVLATHRGVASFLVSRGRLGNSIAHNPAYLYFLLQFALLNVYLPMALRGVHGLGRVKSLAVGIGLASSWVMFGLLFWTSGRGYH